MIDPKPPEIDPEDRPKPQLIKNRWMRAGIAAVVGGGVGFVASMLYSHFGST